MSLQNLAEEKIAECRSHEVCLMSDKVFLAGFSVVMAMLSTQELDGSKKIYSSMMALGYLYAACQFAYTGHQLLAGLAQPIYNAKRARRNQRNTSSPKFSFENFMCSYCK